MFGFLEDITVLLIVLPFAIFLFGGLTMLVDYRRKQGAQRKFSNRDDP